MAGWSGVLLSRGIDMDPKEFAVFAERARELIAEDQLETALAELKALRDALPRDVADDVLLLSARYHRLSGEAGKGLLTQEQHQVRNIQLTSSLLAFLDATYRKLKLRAKPAPVAPEPGGTPEMAPGLEDVAYESILGINNLRDISWIGRGQAAAESVCRVLTPTSMGTGFLVAPGLLMTNNHVVPDLKTATRTQVEFHYERDASGVLRESIRYDLDTATFRTSPAALLDYTLVGVAPSPGKPPLDKWGHLPLNANADPRPKELVAIIQHPNGGLKQIALSANYVTGTLGDLLYYTTDTMKGSSGSPVFNDLWQVIAIHHRGEKVHVGSDGISRFVNEGVLMSAIRPAAGGLWPTHL
jgi:V8-like Glu-specific endopeptidase